MDDATLIARFEDCSLSIAALKHREHVQIAWVYLREAPFEVAAPRFCACLKRFAAHHGKPGLFHATVTWAYLALVNERVHADDASGDFATFAAANPDLFEQTLLGAFYDPATLDSKIARRIFVLPRRA